MNTHSSNIENIKTLLTQLDNAFYNNIDCGLIQHPDLCTFATNMENIITSIKYSLEQLEYLPTIESSKSTNINYAQLLALSTKDRK
jgi:hypothetical protein